MKNLIFNDTKFIGLHSAMAVPSRGFICLAESYTEVEIKSGEKKEDLRNDFLKSSGLSFYDVDDSVNRLFTFGPELIGRRLHICGSHNGLVLLSSFQGHGRCFSYYVYNPMSRVSVQLPYTNDLFEGPFDNQQNYYVVDNNLPDVYLVFEQQIQKYKVIRVCCLQNFYGQRRFTFHIVTVGENAWRELCIPEEIDDSRGVSSNGLLAFFRFQDRQLLIIDASTESFYTVGYPEASGYGFQLVAMDGTLCFLASTVILPRSNSPVINFDPDMGKFRLWMLVKDDAGTHWQPKFELDMFSGSDVPRPLSCLALVFVSCSSKPLELIFYIATDYEGVPKATEWYYAYNLLSSSLKSVERPEPEVYFEWHSNYLSHIKDVGPTAGVDDSAGVVSGPPEVLDTVQEMMEALMF